MPNMQIFFNGEAGFTSYHGRLFAIKAYPLWNALTTT